MLNILISYSSYSMEDTMRLALILAALIICVSPALTQIDIKYEKYKLKNGLTVILHEDDSVPIIGVNVWYYVGSGREEKGKSGFAHLFEHVMFQGSKHISKEDQIKSIEDIGGNFNGSTNTDRTNYWEIVPSNYAETALWLESDRMGFLLEGLTLDKLDNQRDVVKNERRQNYENQPYGGAFKVIMESLYPPDHPYHWLTIGTQEDLTAASLEDIKNFFVRYYVPNNAGLSIAGDFKIPQMKKLVEKWFGDIPMSQPLKRLEPIPFEFSGVKNLLLEDRVQLPRLYLTWHSSGSFTQDEPALQLLSSILGSGKNSRLYRRLVYEKQIAQDVYSSQGSREIAGSFSVVATAKPGVNLTEIKNIIMEEIEKMKNDLVLARELERVKNGYKASAIYRLQNVGGFGGKSDQLNYYEYYTGDPGYLSKDLQRFMNVTAEDILRVAKSYLKSDAMVMLSVVPQGKAELKASH